ncbi:hypothetical protein HOG21_08175 [bacterium]|jgi:hypothetical protein|nr:hypothetical protein [bacterium]
MDVSALDKIYIDLKNDPDIVLTDEIIALYDVLKKEHEKAIIRFKINQAKKSDIISDNSMKDIFTSIENARQKGIDISELEEMIFE